MTAVTHPPIGVPEPSAVRGRLARVILGPVSQAAWIRPALLGTTLLAAVVFIWGLDVSGYANTYYSAAALAASQSWSAWFFGSLDAANFITVDKPPLGTMLMGLSVRLFGLSSWSILLPEALAGVATVALLAQTVRRSFGPAAGTIAGVVMALTPVSILIFRYNNPDALLTLLLVAGAAALIRALESGRLRWVIAAAVVVGLAFDAKYLQAYLVLPAFALTYLVAAPGSVRRRVLGSVVAAVTVAISSLWWVVIVELIPTGLRPYIGGSTTDSAVQLLLGYDGLGRIFGSGGGPGGGGGANFSGAAGPLRLFNAEFGGQISWFIPFALVALATGLWLRRRAARTDRGLAGYVLWGSWLACHAIVFSFMSGIVHTYYAVALAPAVAALVGAGATDLWRLRERTRFGGVLLAGVVLLSAGWAWQLLERTPDFAPGLGIGILIVGVSVAAVLAFPLTLAGRLPSHAAAAVAVVVLLAGPFAYGMDTIESAHSGGDPAAGPEVAGGGGFGGGPNSGPPGGPGSGGPPGTGAGSVSGTGAAPQGANGGGTAPSGGFRGGGGRGGSVDQATLDYLVANRGTATWLVAAVSAGSASSIQLATGQPVMAMGGFSGSDPTPTLAELKAYISSGQLRFVMLGGGGGPGGGNAGVAAERNAWIVANCPVVDLGDGTGTTIYDCQETVP
jgi:4-amino-4-deoxy-L-arabinose transferase-like glycosyltransferase